MAPQKIKSQNNCDLRYYLKIALIIVTGLGKKHTKNFLRSWETNKSITTSKNVCSTGNPLLGL